MNNNDLNELEKIDQRLNESRFDPINTYKTAKQYLKEFISSTDNKHKQQLLQKVKSLKEKENNIINTIIDKNQK